MSIRIDVQEMVQRKITILGNIKRKLFFQFFIITLEKAKQPNNWPSKRPPFNVPENENNPVDLLYFILKFDLK